MMHRPARLDIVILGLFVGFAMLQSVDLIWRRSDGPVESRRNFTLMPYLCSELKCRSGQRAGAVVCERRFFELRVPASMEFALDKVFSRTLCTPTPINEHDPEIWCCIDGEAIDQLDADLIEYRRNVYFWGLILLALAAIAALVYFYWFEPAPPPPQRHIRRATDAPHIVV